ncbi:PfkB family carbohydrate kinase [Olivibacter sp. CPCC 100613]|uniref:PfkB family carbohydrate kinase n=1 Tax=Olivibacter sp. CPCC 100613 TaxID=3079931 RepID=UPI002FFB7DDE
MSLIILGSVAFDALETPFGKTDKIVGGAASYAAIAASYLYDHVKIISVVGEDFGQDNLEKFTSKHIDISGIQIKSGEKSFFWSGRYHNDMNTRDTLVTELNVLGDFDPIIPTSYQDAEYILLGNLSPQVQLNALERLTKRPKLVVMDTMNFWMNIALDDLKEVLKQVDVLTINDEEARQLSGQYSLVKAAAVILTMGPKYLIIKKGEHGALLFGENSIFVAPALPLAEVFDPTGAGDTFAGGFIGYLANKGVINFESMKAAVIYGSALASFCVEKFGTERIETLSALEIDQRIQTFSTLTSFVI